MNREQLEQALKKQGELEAFAREQEAKFAQESAQKREAMVTLEAAEARVSDLMAHVSDLTALEIEMNGDQRRLEQAIRERDEALTKLGSEKLKREAPQRLSIQRTVPPFLPLIVNLLGILMKRRQSVV